MSHPNDRPPLALAGIGVLPVCLAAFVPHYYPESFWYATGTALLIVVLLARVVIQVVQESRERERKHALYEVREMLSDRIRNQLSIVSLSLPSPGDASLNESDLMDARACIDAVNRMVDELDADALDAWKERYAGSRVLTRPLVRQSLVRT